MPFFDRKTAHLRWGRRSDPSATYFLTLCSKNRIPNLALVPHASAILEIIRELDKSQDIETLAANVMPDHAHLLFVLGARLAVGQVSGKLKVLSTRKSDGQIRWQSEGFEHRLRPHESIEGYGRYIFMNPYRAGLCPLNQRWPWWYCPQPRFFRFMSAFEERFVVPNEWLIPSDKTPEPPEAWDL